MKNIVFIGGGSIATALGNVISSHNQTEVVLLVKDKELLSSINNKHINCKYFPNTKLHKQLEASDNPQILSKAEIIFIAIPSSFVFDILISFKNYINPETLFVNLSKGFASNNKLIPEKISTQFKNPFCSMKGPSFASEIMKGMQTGFTIGSENKEHFNVLKNLFKHSFIHLDYSKDTKGVELLSILKNIYAIAIGIVDAQIDSSNLRSVILTKAFNEIREILKRLGGNEISMFCYCGIGDFILTSLSDLSRNKTLGLMLGKGFFVENISEKVVLEGKIALKVVSDILNKKDMLFEFPLISELSKAFHPDYIISDFIKNITNNSDF